jgi:hypothetical protein
MFGRQQGGEVSEWQQRLAAYTGELRVQATSILAEHPEVVHQWSEDWLVFPPASPDGFEVSIDPEPHGVIVFTGVGVHVHVDGSPEEAVRDAIGLVRDLLSSDMRVRELRSGGQGYRWILERREASGWIGEAQTSLLFWNYFGQRSERIYQNSQLPGRLGGVPGAAVPE